MQKLNQIFAAHPTLSTIYIVVGVGFWFFCMFRLHRYIQLTGLDYSSGLYQSMTAKQQRIEWNKYKLKTWLAGIILMSIFSIVWPITWLAYVIKNKK